MQTWVLLSKWEHRSLPSMSIWDIPAFRRSDVVFLMYSMSKRSSVECRTINKLSNRLVVVNWKRRSEWQNLLYIEVSISNLWAGDDFGYFVICRGLPQSILFFVLIFFFTCRGRTATRFYHFRSLRFRLRYTENMVNVGKCWRGKYEKNPREYNHRRY